MSHACRIPNCATPAKDFQLMCWPHWRRVPRALNHAIFETVGRLDRSVEYRSNVAEAVRIVVEKEKGDG